MRSLQIKSELIHGQEFSAMQGGRSVQIEAEAARMTVFPYHGGTLSLSLKWSESLGEWWKCYFPKAAHIGVSSLHGGLS